MKRLALTLTTTLILAGILASTAAAGWTNTGWACTPPQPIIPLGGGAFYTCHYSTYTWWRWTP